jgi:glycerol-3-phosphate acyltransferase PlsX
MGGDFAPRNIVSGCVQAISEFDVHVVLVGNQEAIRAELDRHSYPTGKIEIVHSSEIISMGEQPTLAVRRKRNSSLAVAVDLASRGYTQGIVSAGNTGAMYALVKFAVGTVPGVDRLPLAALFPHSTGSSIVLDVGANVDCKPQHLLEFGLMGSVYAEEILNIQSPRVGLLSIGAEEAKGNELIRETFPLFKKSDIHFIGNVEGHDVFKGTADVIVCDGFVGNVALKVSESLAETILVLVQEETDAHPGISELLTKYFDYSEYGGAPLLGARVPSFVCHGRSSSKAIKNAIRVAVEFCNHRVNERIHKKLSKVVL